MNHTYTREADPFPHGFRWVRRGLIRVAVALPPPPKPVEPTRPEDLVACACGAKIDEPCITTTGEPNWRGHAGRLVERRCPCGAIPSRFTRWCYDCNPTPALLHKSGYGQVSGSLPACPTCGVDAGRMCRSGNGSPLSNPHRERTNGPAACQGCGGKPRTPRSRYCEPCRQQARAGTYKRYTNTKRRAS